MKIEYKYKKYANLKKKLYVNNTKITLTYSVAFV